MDYKLRRAQAREIYLQGLERVKNDPVPAGQKFPPGTRVRIAEDLGRGMSHFPSGRLATVEYSYAHAYGGDNVKSYSLKVDGIGEVAWYKEHQLERCNKMGDEIWAQFLNTLQDLPFETDASILERYTKWLAEKGLLVDNVSIPGITSKDRTSVEPNVADDLKDDGELDSSVS